jgi:predicted PurR-regulated permease PerM
MAVVVGAIAGDEAQACCEPRSGSTGPSCERTLESMETNVAQGRALKVLALAAMLTIVWVALPVGVGLFLGVLLAFTLQPIDTRLRGRGWSAGASSVACVVGATILITTTVAGFAVVFISRGVALAQSLPPSLAPGGSVRRFATRMLTTLHIDPTSQFARLEEHAVSFGSRAAGIAADVAGATFTAMLTLFFLVMAAYFALRHWDEIVCRAEKILPFAPRHTRALLGQLRRVGSQVLRGTVVTGAVQGVLSAVGYWITGVPDPLFFGALTAVASLVPIVGSLLVWVPAGIYLALTGHAVAATVELVYGALVVVVVTDYVVRPRLVGRGGGVPTILTFVSLFGGVEVFGIIGLVIGPVIVTLCVAILKTYEEEVTGQAASGPAENAAK